jgi:hypothetical protein
VHLLAIPYTLAMGALKKRYPKMATVPKLHEITPGLYLGTIQAATDEKLLKQHGITYVLSVVDFEVALSSTLSITYASQ